jgi:hypothetical protein
VFPALSFTVCTAAAVSFHPTTTTFRSPAVCAPGYVTVTVAVGDCGVDDATCANPIATVELNVNPFVRLPLCPLTVTVTVAAPAACAGVVAVIVVPFTTTTLVAAVPPIVTVAPAAKFVPVIVTAVPPAADPLFGEMLLTVGTTTYVYPFAKLPPDTPGFVTVTVTAPALPAGVVAVIVVLFTTVTPVAAVPPNVTVAPAAKFVPVIVTAVPPVVDPVFGETLLTVAGTT